MGSLREILIPNKAPSAKKIGSRTTSQVTFQEDIDADSIVRSILLEETGAVDKVRRKSSKRKKFASEGSGTIDGRDGDSNLQTAQFAKSSYNTVQAFAQEWGLPKDDISYIEKQFRQLHSLLRTSSVKLDKGYEDMQIDSDGDRRHVDSFVFSQAILLASYSGINIDTEDMVEICKKAARPFDQQRTVPMGYTGEISLDDEAGLDNYELDFRRWKTLILSHHRKHLIMGLLAEKEGKLQKSSTSFLDSQGPPEFGNIANQDYPSMADMPVAASILEAPSVATYNSNDLFDDFDMSFAHSTSKILSRNQSLYSKTSAEGLGGKGARSVRSTTGGRTITGKLPRIKSVPNMKFKSKTNKNVKKMKRSASSVENTIIERPEDDTNPMERVAMLRRELEQAKEGLAELDEKLDSNIAWVHTNCDTSVIGSISSSGKDKVRKIAVGKLFSVIDIRLKHSMYKALRQWENVIFTAKIRKIARDFSQIKCIEILTRVLNVAICRRFKAGWQPWMQKVRLAMKWERNMGAVELQRVARGMLARLSLKDEMIRKCIVKIQALLRRRLGVKRAKKIRMLKALAEKKAARIRRDNDAFRVKMEAQRKEEELKRRRGPARGHDHRSLRARHTDAAIKIQKLHRGNVGRERFFVHKQNHSANKIQKIIRGKLGRKRFKKIKGEQKTSFLGELLGGIAKPKAKKADKSGGGGGVLGKLGFSAKKSQENSDNESAGSHDAKPTSSRVGVDKIKNDPIIKKASKPSTPNSETVAENRNKTTKDEKLGRSEGIESNKRPKSGQDTRKKAIDGGKNPDAPSSTSSQKPGSASSTSSQKPGSASSTSSQKPGSASSTSSRKASTTYASKGKDQDSSRSASPTSTSGASSLSKKDDSPAEAAPPKKLSKLQQMKAEEEKKKREKEINDAKAAVAEIEKEAERIKEEAMAEKAKIKEQAERDAAEMKVQAEEELAEARAELEEELFKEKEEWMKQLEELKKQNEELQAAKAAADNAKAEIEAKAEKDLANAKAEAEQKASEAVSKAAKEAKSTLKSEPVGDAPTSSDPVVEAPTLPAQNDGITSNTAIAPDPSPDEQRLPPPSTEHLESISKTAPTSDAQVLGDESIKTSPQQDQSQSSSLGSISLAKSIGSFWKKTNTTEETVRPATTDGSSTQGNAKSESRPSSAFSNLFGGGKGKDKKKGKKKKKQKFVPPTIDKLEADRRITRASNMKAAYNEVKRRREAAQAAQALVGKRILWAVVIIQARMARGPIGRNRFMQHQDDLIKAREVRRNRAATKIQAMVRAVPDRIRVREIRAEKEREEKLASMLKFKKDQEDANAYKVQGSGLTPEQEAALQAKLDRLAEMEKSIIEKELKMAQATRLADERAAAMEKAMKDFEERARVEEAERAMQRQMMELAAGPVQTARSEAPAPDPKTTRTPRTKRDNYDAPPTARSAREEGIPKDAEKVSFEGRKWYQLWDEQESAYYWYCPGTKAAQWEKPGETGGGYESGGYTTDYSTDWYESGGDYTDGEGDMWQEYFDEGAQAKYWYNPSTGEASWVPPQSSANSSANRSRKNSAKLTAKEVPAAAYEAPDDWISYLDAETQQEYWYNTKTGETSWDR